MNDEIVIRDYAATDRAAVNYVASSAWNQYAAIFEDWDGLAEIVTGTASLSENADLIVAERAGVVVGYVGPNRPREAGFPDDWAIVRMLSVLPTDRGRGIGRLLTQACVDRARRDGVATVGLHTSPVMRSALDLYLSMGFAFRSPIPDRRGAPYALYTLDVGESKTHRHASSAL